MTDNDRKVALMDERAALKRERCCFRKELGDLGSLFTMHGQKIRNVLEGFPKPDKADFTGYPSSKELSDKFLRLHDIEKRIKEIEDCVPELKV
ncbi:MAG: hypothetical protein OXH84_00330 [Gammaproteobacteria bacterium]|nr:hypothetical protein [Gammaproteobacteria bacterium]